MKRIPVIIALFLAVPLIAQTAKLTVPPSVSRECHHYHTGRHVAKAV